MRGAPQRPITELREEEYQQLFHDPRLLHRNLDFNRKKRLYEMRPEIADRDLERAYERILIFNEAADEANYMNDFFSAVQDRHLGGAGSDLVNQAAWKSLFRAYDVDRDGRMNAEEFKALAKACRIKERKPSDAEVDLLHR